MHTTFTCVPSPLGTLTLTATDDGLTGIYFPTSRHEPSPIERTDWRADASCVPASKILERTRQQLEEYFAGTRTVFEIGLAVAGTVFERRVWDELRAIPYGTTVSYGELARRLGNRRATRAVGAANARNPTPIVVPCHRVVGARGDLTGFGGGIDRKRWLLEHEGALMALGG